METVALLKCLSEASGVSGYEDQVRSTVHRQFALHADEVKSDALGNLIAFKQGCGAPPRRAIMIATHMDEIGLVVSELEGGFIHFQQVGGYDDRVLLAQEVVVHGRRDLAGLIGARPPHLLSQAERQRAIPYDQLRIDVGLSEKELPELVRVGDLVTMKRALVELKGGFVAGKAMDNRASVAALAICLAELRVATHAWDVYAVATVQEEMGCKGAVTSAYGLQPDIGIAVDVTFGNQPGAPDDLTVELGKGPAIGCGPNFHPKLFAALVEAAKGLEMSHHIVPEDSPGGTDAYAIQISRAGIPAALLSIPVRNMHTPVETVAIKDIERTGRLLSAFVRGLDDGFLSGLVWDLGLDNAEE